jgi:uncharacterized protein with NRDE domain
MCLIAYAWNAHPSWPLVLVANRDEFRDRPAAALAPWTDDERILGGRDLEADGGWLAIRRDVRKLAAVTNVREIPLAKPDKSRGLLVADYLRGDESAVGYAELRRMDGNDYGPFNLMLWDGEDLVLATNRLKPRWENAAHGVRGLSNGRLESVWPKTARVSAALAAWLKQLGRGDEPDLEPLFEALADQTPTPDAELPDTGIGLERERMLSSPFIHLPGYGTRASSVVLVGLGGQTIFAERSLDANGQSLGLVRIELSAA